MRFSIRHAIELSSPFFRTDLRPWQTLYYSSAIFVGKLNLKRAGNVIALVHYEEKMKTKGWFSAQVRTRAEREA